MLYPLSYGRTWLFPTLRRRPCQGRGDVTASSRHDRDDDQIYSHQRKQSFNQLIDRLIIGRDAMIGRRLIFRRPFPQHVLNFIDERVGPSQRGALIVTADSFRDRLDGGRQPKHGAILLQRLDILRAMAVACSG